MAIVYQHIRKDNNKPFYIGIGNDIKRAYSKFYRNEIWYRIVEKYGYKIEILFNNIEWEEACIIEKKLIKKYGRVNTKTGILCNMTDGGEGACGIIFTESHKNKIGKKTKINWTGRKHNENTIMNMSSNRTGENNKNTKLTNEDVIWIRNNYHLFSVNFLCEKYNISQSALFHIKARRTWKHI